jgi:hypothetical protein
MINEARPTVITTRCGRRIAVGHAAIPATPIRWVTVRISAGEPRGHSAWVSLTPAEASALGAALLARAAIN